jgi:hypothetical protein
MADAEDLKDKKAISGDSTFSTIYQRSQAVSPIFV